MTNTTKIIDLAGANTSDAVLRVFGKALFLGGRDGNHPVMAVDAGEGWGLNWDALQDSLLLLDSGGVWGSSPGVSFPLSLEVVNCSSFRNKDPRGYGILEDILRTVKERYAEQGMELDYEFR